MTLTPSAYALLGLTAIVVSWAMLYTLCLALFTNLYPLF